MLFFRDTYNFLEKPTIQSVLCKITLRQGIVFLKSIVFKVKHQPLHFWLRPRLHGTASVLSLYEIEWFEDEYSFQIYDHITEFNNNYNHRKSGKSKCYRKLTDLDIMTMWIRYRVNGF